MTNPTEVWHQTTEVVTWYLPKGVDPNTAPVQDWFPQTLDKPETCGYAQVDTYKYDTALDRGSLNLIRQDGKLTYNGKAEDAGLVQSAYFVNTCELAQTGPIAFAPMLVVAVLLIALGAFVVKKGKTN